MKKSIALFHSLKPGDVGRPVFLEVDDKRAHNGEYLRASEYGGVNLEMLPDISDQKFAERRILYMKKSLDMAQGVLNLAQFDYNQAVESLNELKAKGME